MTTLARLFLSPLFSVFLCTLVGGASSSFRVFGPCSFASPVCFGSVFVLPFLSPFSLPSPGSSFPSGVVPGLSGRRLVQDFQRRPHFFWLCLFSFCSPLFTSLQKVFLWHSGRRLVRRILRWFPTILPGTVFGSGAAFHTDLLTRQQAEQTWWVGGCPRYLARKREVDPRGSRLLFTACAC